MFVFLPIAHANSFGVSLDKNFYFQDFNDREIEITAKNDSNKLIFADIEVYEGRIGSSDKVEYDLEKKVHNYDILPESVAIPAKQTKKIRLVRAASSKTINTEEYYRVRIIPKSADAALKDNPALLAALSTEDKQQLEDTQNISGAVRLYIGSGSVLIVQDKKTASPKSLEIRRKRTADGIDFNLLNTSATSLDIKQLRVYFGAKSLSLGNLALRGNKGTTVSFTNAALTGNSLTGNENFEKAKFVAQDNQEYSITIQ
ncbi:hypothetical protein GCM10017655_28800 [Pseudomonas turukhanskensis]|uniref:Uncharacterized protein n=2 Tax=Pseudomonas turukhanskensis TaxID=1806536 RepID=A0A9W6NG90_9PSED|nr:hypothetical protein GCM10017655_28800 [Pseudomonas turukhanskensis]